MVLLWHYLGEIYVIGEVDAITASMVTMRLLWHYLGSDLYVIGVTLALV